MEEKKVEEEKIEPKQAKIPKNGMIYNYPSQNATSRRRNFKGQKWDVYGGLEERAKDLSAVFCYELITKRNTQIMKALSFEKEEGSLDYEWSAEETEAPKIETLLPDPEPSMGDQVNYDADCGGLEKQIEKMKDGDDRGKEEAQEDRKNAEECTKDDQKNPIDLGDSEMERNRRLESLIARRRARKLLKLQIENGLIDMKLVTPSQLAPLFITRANPFDSSKGLKLFDGIEMPGSAPSALRSPFDLPYDPSEEKPILTGDSFSQEFISHQRDMLFSKHESFTYGTSFPEEHGQDHEARESNPFFMNGRKGSDKLAYQRHIMIKLSDKGNYDWLTEQSNSKEDSESGSRSPNPPSEREEETTHEEDDKYNNDTLNMKSEENADLTHPMSDYTSEPELIPKISNVEIALVSEKLGPRVPPKPHERVLNFPIASSTTTIVNDSLYESIPSPVDKNQENMFFTHRRICHTPTYSIASDLQVEVSEIGSPTLTVDEGHETNTTWDEETLSYNGDVDKDITSGSEDMWGASLHSRGVHGASEDYIAENGVVDVNSWRDIASSIPLQHIDEENAADVSSMSSRSDMPADTPTHTINSDNNIIFGNVEDFVRETEAPQPSGSSDVPLSWKHLMDSSVDHLPHETHSEQPEEWCNQSENLIERAQDINDENKSATTEQDNTHNSNCNEDPSALVVGQDATDELEVSINSSLSSSPRSVLPQKNTTDQVSSSAYNQQMHIGVQQSNLVAQATLNDEGPLNTMPQNIQPSMDDPTFESHNNDIIHSQDQTDPPENFSVEESNMFRKMNDAEVCNKEDEEKLTNDEISEDKSTSSIRQDATAESPRLAEMKTSEDMTEKSRALVDDKVPLNSLMLESSLSEVHRENEDKPQESMRQEATMEPLINTKETDMSYAKDFEGKDNGLNQNGASSRLTGESDKMRETDKPNHGSEEVNYMQNESKEVVEDNMKGEKLDWGEISKDSTPPIVTEVTNSISAEDASEKSDKVNKDIAAEHELHKNGTMVLSESVGDSDKVSNISHIEKPEENDNSNKNIATEQALNKNEAMVSSESMGESDKVSNISHMPDKPNNSSKVVGYTQRESTEFVEDDMKKNEQSNDNENKQLTELLIEPTWQKRK